MTNEDRLSISPEGVVERVGDHEVLVRTADSLANLAVFVWGERTVTVARETCLGSVAQSEAGERQVDWKRRMARCLPAIVSEQVGGS